MPRSSSSTGQRRHWSNDENRSTKRRRGALLAVAAIFSIGAAVVPSAPAAHAAEPVTINLVTVNDFHGRIERDGAVAGAAALSTAVKQIRAANPNTVFAAAGDLIGASTFTSFIQRDEPTIAALNAAGLEVSAVGNHEFDQGYADLMTRVLPLANWEYLGANVRPTGPAPALPEYWTRTLSGVTIGFIGVVTDELPSLVNPAGISGLSIEAPLTAANRVANQLSDGNVANGEADIVVLLVHEGAATTALASATDPTSRFGQIVNGANGHIDAIVSGHTHLAYNHVINGRPVISSGQYGERFSNMTIQVDPDTKQILSMVNTIIALPGFADDPVVAPIVSAATAAGLLLGGVKLGDVTADFNRARFANGVTENRGGESTIGNFVADVHLWAASQNGSADIAFMNPGGLRANIAYAPDGVVTFKEAANVQPFANTLVTMDLTGAQVKTVLEQQWQPVGATRPFLKLGVNKELTYVYDPTAPAGQRITRITLNGQEVTPTRTYRVVVNSFLSAGGDNFVELANGTRKVDTGKVDLQSMVDWFATNRIATPDLKQRAVGMRVTTPNAVGEALTVDLSSLDMSTTETKAGTVQATLGGVSFGSGAVNPAVVDTTDEVGRATFVAQVPATLYGLQDLVITVPSTGTTATLPVFLKAATSTLAYTNTPTPKAGSTVIVWVEISAPIPVSGSFTVAVDGDVTDVIDYLPNNGKRVKVKLPKSLTPGAHRIDVTFNGSAELLTSTTSFTITAR